MPVRFGASVWPWKWNPPYDEAIRRIAKSGFNATELIVWNEEMLAEYYTPNTISLLRATLDDEGLELSQFVVRPTELSHSEPARRSSAADFFKRGVDVGVALGASVINSVTHAPFALAFPLLGERARLQTFAADLPEGLDWQDNWERYVEVLRECSDYVQAAGLTYSLEPHPFRYGGTTEGILRLLEAVGSPALGVNFDPSHLFAVGDFPNVSIHRLGSHLLHCHFSDNDGTANLHWRPGKGKIDWLQTLTALRDVGYSGVISLEFEDVPGVVRGTRLPRGSIEPDEATSEILVSEYRVGLDYLMGLAAEVGLKVAS